MDGHDHLPTCVTGDWSVTALKDSLCEALKTDRALSELRLYFYAVTNSGWDQIRSPVVQWLRGAKGRSVVLFVGTDHAITDPSAIRRVEADGVVVRLMVKYQGVFHPKVIWLSGKRGHMVWVGSNNLTRDGLLNNIEFAVLAKSRVAPASLNSWAEAVLEGSQPLEEQLLRSYEKQRKKFEKGRANSGATTFTWDRKTEPEKSSAPVAPPGSLIVEVMPRETGEGGKQLQLPIAAAKAFFGLGSTGSTTTLKFSVHEESRPRSLTMTVFGNSTVRVVLRALEYRDRPCVVVFRKIRKNYFQYAIIAESIYPHRYRALLAQCKNQTRFGSRRWGFVREAS